MGHLISIFLVEWDSNIIREVQGPKKWFAAKEGLRQEQAIFSGSVI